MALLNDQVFRNASVAFEQDPELRELLRTTFDKAEGASPFAVNNLVGIPGQNTGDTYNQATGQGGAVANAPNTTTVPKPLGAPMAPMPAQASFPPNVTPVNRAAKQDQAIQFQSMPNTPENLAAADQLGRFMQQGGGQQPGQQPPGGPVQPQVGSAPPQTAARPGGGQIPQLPKQSQIGAFLAGLGSSDAILPAIGGGIQAVESADRQHAAQNTTLRALINRGLDPETAMAAVQNPAMLKAILPRMFGLGKKKLETIKDDQGRERSAFVDEYGNYEIVGGAAPSGFDKDLQKQSLDVIKEYRENARNAETTIGLLDQLERARGNIDYEGYPLADLWARFQSVVMGEGGGEDVRSAAAKIQLGFTKDTKGAISDREMSLFELATPGLKMGDAGAKRVITAMRATAKRAVERNKFYQQWAKINQGDLTGADDAWDRYIEENPVVQQNENGDLFVNERNITNWQGYLPGGRRARGVQYRDRQPRQAPGQPTQGRPSPADFGEMRPGMYQDPQDGAWKWQNPRTGVVEIWEPPN